ncbi:3'-5' exonuclease [Nakamurella antarctica]|uniref:3'-5' exonuclease n=2 Tax=Nakamurella antarctica TaxID=1902245 RepID=A0A3G8ZQM1_9ACTN|nr:3'-5' exonuclease [Nakamurella antarctica]
MVPARTRVAAIKSSTATVISAPITVGPLAAGTVCSPPARLVFAPPPPAQLFAGTLVGFDTETTGIDTATARIVTAALVHLDPSGEQLPATRSWLLDPGVDIPAEASAIHGISTEHARTHGRPAALAIAEIIAGLRQCWAAGHPTVIFNASYDLSLLDSEARRHGLTPLTDLPEWAEAVIIDPLVIDRFVDRYRRGKRTLDAASAVYSVPTPDAHNATGDSIAAVAVARAIAHKYPLIRNAGAEALRSSQVEWQRNWAINFQSYLRSRGEADAVIDSDWPLRAGAATRAPNAV